MSHDHEYPDALSDGRARGRGAQLNPKNRYEALRLHVLGEHLDELRDQGESGRQVATQVIPDRTKTIINRVDSPDVPFDWSINPYRGCEHGCVYCYARPDHERLGYSSGLDFETKIVAKLDAPALLEKELAAAKWRGEPITMAGVTDVYQPVEADLRITRGCLEVMAGCRQATMLVTKSRLILRDLDLLGRLAEHDAVRVAISITTLDAKLAASMEPRAASPAHRLEAIRRLSDAGVPVMVLVAPMIPGLTDRETASILEAASNAGARAAGYVLLRLPHQVKAIFLSWLSTCHPDRAGHVESLIRQTRDNALYDSAWGTRKRGCGPVADHLSQMFDVFCRRHGLSREQPSLNTCAFRKPLRGGQIPLFGA